MGSLNLGRHPREILLTCLSEQTPSSKQAYEQGHERDSTLRAERTRFCLSLPPPSRRTSGCPLSFASMDESPGVHREWQTTSSRQEWKTTNSRQGDHGWHVHPGEGGRGERERDHGWHVHQFLGTPSAFQLVVSQEQANASPVLCLMRSGSVTSGSGVVTSGSINSSPASSPEAWTHDVRTSVDALCASELVGCVSDRANSTHELVGCVKHRANSKRENSTHELHRESELVCHIVGQVSETVMHIQEQLVLLTHAVPEALEQRKAVIDEMKGALMVQVPFI